ncbi:hypothetical protein AC579_9196 [Pseudocercospora musae]|uniref:RRM domain-containing protein n=1 Tax=Pseudocercospora musae TaxID=113226 RepID=A0A139H9L7_9PEZI|nr:hypothetical protein AC579_9196 [Pseudocercospora musae]
MAPKKKQEKMALGDFLTNQSLGSWADEMDSQPLPSMASTSSYGGARDRDRGDGPGERRAFTQPSWERGTGGGVGSGMGGDRMGGNMGGRGPSYDRPRFEREAVPFPTKPPYTAHLGNLDYNVTSADIEDFLADCEVTTVRIMEDKVDRKPKGFGYVEFGSADGLRKALDKTEASFMGRNIKISVADPPRNDAGSNRDFSDWSRKGPLPDLPQQGRQPSRGFSRNFDNMSDAGSERGGPGGRKPGFFEGDGKVRDFGNWERKGPLSPVPGQAAPMGRDGGRQREGGPPRDRRASPSWGEGRSDAGSRPPRKEYERPQVERVPTAAEQDSQWRSKMRPDPSPAATPDASTPTSPAQPEAPKERPRLNLAKRTVSTAEPGAASSASSDSKASPFGAARPIDTAAREREVEEKRQMAIREKAEADAKAKEEKAQRDTEQRAARAERADRGQAEQEGEKAKSPTEPRANWRDGGNRRPSRQQNGPKGQPKEKENGETGQAQRPKFSILQHGEDGEGQDLDTPDAPANGTIVADKEVKPQEPVVPAGQTAETSAEALEDDGWSTVPAKSKTNRRGGGRAIAS